MFVRLDSTRLKSQLNAIYARTTSRVEKRNPFVFHLLSFRCKPKIDSVRIDWNTQCTHQENDWIAYASLNGNTHTIWSFCMYDITFAIRNVDFIRFLCSFSIPGCHFGRFIGRFYQIFDFLVPFYLRVGETASIQFAKNRYPYTLHIYRSFVRSYPHTHFVYHRFD